MAGNKFATMLHRNTSKFIVVLVYAVLEWTLIILLLLNSLFNYLITKFANYFGLKPPCPLCTSRLEHVLERGKSAKSYTDLVCESHATEISNMCYCLNHKKLANSESMCGNCFASQPNYRGISTGMTRMAFISWLSENKLEKDENSPCICSCCCVSLNSKPYPPFSPFDPCWGSLEYAQKGDSTIETVDGDNNGGEHQGTTKPDSLSTHSDNGYEMETTNEEHEDDRVADEHQFSSDVCSSSFRENAEEDCPRSRSTLLCHETDANEDGKAGSPDITRSDSNSMKLAHQSSDASAATIDPGCFGEDYSLEIIPLPSENGMACALNQRLIPIELIDFSTAIDQGIRNLKEDDMREHGGEEGSFDSVSTIRSRDQLSEEAEERIVNESAVKTSNGEVETLEKARGYTNNASVEEAEDGNQDLVVTVPGAQILHVDIEEPSKKEPNDPTESEEKGISADHIVSRNLANTDASDHATDQSQAQEDSLSPRFESPNVPDTAQNDNGTMSTEKASLQEQTSMLEEAQEGITHLRTCSEPNEPEEEKFPDTPKSVNGLGYLHKKLDEKREPALEEYLDGSMGSETEGGDPFTTIGRLKEALTAERKALSALYAELEEERSASAIAANQTMAMITRLQEEKAAMQMEALQYQRMMEEQSEYDQDALQLLNELMNKKEKEKQELEKELEIYQKKVLDYEEKEKIGIMSRIKYGSVSRNSSASCSHSWDSDKLSIDLNPDMRDEDSGFGGHQDSSNHNTTDDADLNLEEIARDCVKNMNVLDESLAGFEEERLSILDQLKALEEKLITLGENEEFSEDLALIQNCSTSIKDFEENHEFSSAEETGISNGSSQDDHHPAERNTLGSMAKRLLPLLDANDNETEEGLMHEEQVDSESIGMQKTLTNFDLPDNKIALEEEVDHVYERLQALEADREFLTHCMSSIKKGDKGVDLLQEILQHLRDLRVVELRATNMSDPEDEVAVI